MLMPKRVKSVTSSNMGRQQANPAGVFVHLAFNDANGAERQLDSDVFATRELAEAARTSMKSVLKALGAQNIKSSIKEERQ